MRYEPRQRRLTGAVSVGSVWVGSVCLRRALGIAFALNVTSCGPPPVAQAKRNIETVDKEREPHKLFVRGKAFAQRGDLTRAEQYLTAALREGAEPTEVLPVLLRVCVSAGRFRVAISHATLQLRSAPNNVPLRFLLGTLFQTINDSDSAREQFERVVATQPSHAEAHFALAVVARDNDGDMVRADRHFREYLRLLPDGPRAEEARSSLLKSVP